MGTFGQNVPETIVLQSLGRSEPISLYVGDSPSGQEVVRLTHRQFPLSIRTG
jgi:hypothetical protein